MPSNYSQLSQALKRIYPDEDYYDYKRHYSPEKVIKDSWEIIWDRIIDMRPHAQ